MVAKTLKLVVLLAFSESGEKFRKSNGIWFKCADTIMKNVPEMLNKLSEMEIKNGQ